jgi:hypothetical protein
MTTPQLGAASSADGSGDYNPIDFIARQVLAGAAIATLVQVKAVNGNTVNVHPLVNQVDGLGNATPHGVVNGIKWIQLQSGPSGIIIPPAANDIGLAVFADRDISSVVASGGQANPGSARRNDYADGIYVTALPGLNSAPTQFIQFLPNAGGINVVTPGNISVSAGGNATVTASGNATVTAANAIIKAGTIALQNAGTALKTLLNSLFAQWAASHVHSNGNDGGNTGVPTTAPPTGSQTSVVMAE